MSKTIEFRIGLLVVRFESDRLIIEWERHRLELPLDAADDLIEACAFVWKARQRERDRP